jgi:YhcH/YjgK/YiaL family protein
MILDTMAQAARYESLHKRFKKAFDYIRNTDLSSLAVGKYKIEGDDIFGLIQEYKTLSIDEKQFETHRNYIDIQYIISGEEMMGYTTPENLSVKTPYNPDKDCEFYHDSQMSECVAGAGSYAVFFPEEPHKPGCTVTGKSVSDIKKLVLKIKF